MVKIKQHPNKCPQHLAVFAASALKLATLAAITTGALLLSTASASKHLENMPRGFDNYYNNVFAIQSYGRDEEWVLLKGRLTSYINDDCYEFTDEMGNSIEVELDDDVNWGLVSKDQLIEIFGDIDRNMFRLQIDAKGYKILEPAPGIQAASADAAAASAASIAPAAATVPTAAAARAAAASDTAPAGDEKSAVGSSSRGTDAPDDTESVPASDKDTGTTETQDLQPVKTLSAEERSVTSAPDNTPNVESIVDSTSAQGTSQETALTSSHSVSH